jgi:glycolate oxidase FAD binding subunit
MLSFTPTSVDHLQKFMESEAVPLRRAVSPEGGRTALRCGFPLRREATAIDMTPLQSVIDYPARDMTITVETGIRVAQLQQLLAGERQRLAIDIAHPALATIGGAIATNTSGPRRFGHGTFRDYLIGVTAIDGQGRLFHAGGRVVKNVAGYDLCKLLIGSQGTLGIITQVTLKLRPLPESTQIVWWALDGSDEAEAALQKLVTTQTRPVAVELYNAKGTERLAATGSVKLPTGRYGLCLVLEGSEAEVRWQVQTLLSEMRVAKPAEELVLTPTEATAIQSAMTEFCSAPADQAVAHLSVPASQVAGIVSQLTLQGMAIQSHAASGIVHALLSDRHMAPENLPAFWDKVVELATSVGGTATLSGGSERSRDPLPVMGQRRPDWSVMEGIKKSLDPHDLLNPGRVRLRG